MLELHTKIVYDLHDKKRYVTDIFSRLVTDEPYGTRVALFDTYTIRDGQTAQEVAREVYQDETKDWVLFFFNDIINPLSDWCMSQIDLEAYTEAVHGSTTATHHYTDTDGYVASSGTPVTNLEYEEGLNEARRDIRVLRPQYLTRFLDLYASLVQAA